jgi:ABC-type glycerol-3-phosphate transport system permease component
VISQLFWIAPGLGIVIRQGAGPAGAYALWLGNWLVFGFSIVLLRKATALIPAALDDTVRMDGLGGFAAWRHAVLPFVRRDLVLLGIFTVMATLLPFWGVITQPEAGDVIMIFERTSTPTERLTWMVVGSLVGALPLIAIFFLTRRNPSPQSEQRLRDFS